MNDWKITKLEENVFSRGKICSIQHFQFLLIIIYIYHIPLSAETLCVYSGRL